MDLGLNKLPWWGQLALYAVVGGGLIATQHYMYAVDLQARVQAERVSGEGRHRDITELPVRQVEKPVA